MFAFPDVTKDEMIRIAEGLTVVPTEKTEGNCVMQLCDWNQTEEGKYSFEDNYMEGGISMVVYRLPQNEKVDELLSTDVAESEELEVGGRPAVYLEKVSSAAKNLYVIYAEHINLCRTWLYAGNVCIPGCDKG